MYNVKYIKELLMTKIGNTLKMLRKSEKLTQQQVADKLNISRVNYTRYELDYVCPDYDTLIAIADFYDITLDELFDRHKK